MLDGEDKPCCSIGRAKEVVCRQRAQVGSHSAANRGLCQQRRTANRNAMASTWRIPMIGWRGEMFFPPSNSADPGGQGGRNIHGENNRGLGTLLACLLKGSLGSSGRYSTVASHTQRIKEIIFHAYQQHFTCMYRATCHYCTDCVDAAIIYRYPSSPCPMPPHPRSMV